MKKVGTCSFALIFAIAAIFLGSSAIPSPVPDDKILIDSGVPSWVPNPLAGSHKWKKFFSDDKYSSSKKPELVWYYDSKTVIKATTETLNVKGQALGLEGATLVWVKVVGSKPSMIMFLFYALWPAKRVALFFGIYEKEDGTRYVEDIGEIDEIEKMASGLPKEVLENLFNAISKPWWKVWK